MQVFSYQILDENVIKSLASTDPCIVVYDKKPLLSHPSVQLYDINTFKISTWMNKFNHEGYETIIFQIEKFSLDCLYGFFRNIYANPIVFTDDPIFKEKICRDSKLSVKVNIVPDFIFALPEELQSLETFGALAAKSSALRALLGSCQVSWLHRMCMSLYRFLKLTVYKLSILIDMIASCKKNNRVLVVLSNDDYVSRLYSDVTSARSMLEGSAATCFVFDFNESFNYSRFADSVVFISNLGHEETSAVADGATESHVDACRSFFLEFGFIGTSHAHILTDIFTIHNFKGYLSGVSMADHTKIARCFAPDPSCNAFMRLKEVSCGGTTFPFTHARSIVEHLLHTVKITLEQSFIYIRTLHPTVVVASGGFMNKEFCATMSLPGLFGFACTGDHYVSKKDTVQDASVKFITKLIDEGIFDSDLNIVSDTLLKLPTVQDLYMTAYGTCDLKSIARLQSHFVSVSPNFSQWGSIVEKDGKISILGEGKDMAKEAFKKKYMVDLEVARPCSSKAAFNTNNDRSLGNLVSYFYADTPQARLERVYRKIPDCLSRKVAKMSLYTFSNSRTGILCGSSFKETCRLVDYWGKDVEISYGGTRVYSDDEIKMLVFYQVIFFKMYTRVYINTKQAFTLYYYAAPLNESMEIDWPYLSEIYSQFLQDYVYNKPGAETMIWSPFTREFLVYARTAEMSLEHPVGNTTYLEFFENRHRVKLTVRTGKMIFRAYSARNVLNRVKKYFNAGVACTTSNDDDSDETPVAPKPIFVPDSFQPGALDGSSTLRYPSIDSLGVDTVEISSAECCFATPLKTTILMEIEIFTRNYSLIDNLLIAEELRRAYALDLELKDVVMCFTQASESELHNYEKLELIGDCVLKFITTNYLYLSGLSMDLVSLVKDYIICNQSLYRNCIDSGIYRYLKTHRFYSKMVQAPAISGADECMKYFDAVPIFNSDNYNNATLGNSMSQDTKLYADMIEAIIGALFLAGGASRSAEFIYRLGIIKPMDFTDTPTHHQAIKCFMKTTFDSLQASGIGEESIADIKEKIQGMDSIYYSAASLPFNRISVITDQDSLFFRKPFTEFIYSGVLLKSAINTVEEIVGYHYTNPGNLERALVHPSWSNVLGSMDFQYLELIGDCALDFYITNIMAQDPSLSTPLILHSHKKAFVNNSSLCRLFYRLSLDKYAKFNLPPDGRSKAYSDIAEALIGSMLVDLQWNYKKLFEAMNVRLRSVLEDCASEISFD